MNSKSSKTESFREFPETILVGRVRRPHGVQGDLLIEVLSDFPGRFDVDSELDLVRVDGRRERVCIRRSRPHRLGRLVGLGECSSRDDAEELRDATFEIDRTELRPAPEGAYYYHELVGCRCLDRKAGELGVVDEIVEDGGGVLLRVLDGSRELLVPFVESFLELVDVEKGVIEMRLPDGLIETCASKS